VVDLHVTCIMFKVPFSGGRHGGFEKMSQVRLSGGRQGGGSVACNIIMVEEKKKKNVTSMTFRWSAT